MSLVINIILEIEIINGVLIQIHTHPPLKRQESPAKKRKGISLKYYAFQVRLVK